MTAQITPTGTLIYAIDPAHSRAHFAIRHLAIAHVRGEFTQVGGTVEYDPANLSSLRINATIDANSFHSGNPQRDEHVKGDHFLDVAKYPTITFVSNKATATGAGKAQVVGDLTLHGIIKPAFLPVKHAVPHKQIRRWYDFDTGPVALARYCEVEGVEPVACFA